MTDAEAEITVRDALDAFDAAREWWAALAEDDDLATRELTYEMSRLRTGLPEVGLAGALRERFGVTVDQSRSIGFSTTVRILRGGAVAVLAKPVAHLEIYLEPAQALVHWTVMWRNPVTHRWQFWGSMPDGELEHATLLVLPIDLPPAGPPS